MSVAQAISLWPQLEAVGLRLGSPAVSANAPDPSGWLAQFMSQVSLLVISKVPAHSCGGAYL